MDIDAFQEFAERFKNWGRWGPDDEVGTLNFVTPQHIVEAARLVRTGKVFSLAIPFDSNGPQRPRPDSKRFNPLHVMLKTGLDFEGDTPPLFQGTDDMVSLPLQAATQWDGFGHFMYKGHMYNGHPYSTVTSDGATRNGIERLRSKGIGRGVLLDIARHRGVPWMEPGDDIQADELDACGAKQGVEVKDGDFLLVRTGNIAMVRERGEWGDYSGGHRPGLGFSTIEWLYDKRVASVAADNFGIEVYPSDVEGMRVHLHPIAIPLMGMLLGEIFDLEELAADCAGDGIYEFLFVAPPLPVTNAVGSPINPYAVK